MARRKKSSRSWRLPTSQRRDLYVSRYLHGLVELLELHARRAGADSIDTEWLEHLEEYLSAGLGDAFDAGAEPVPDLASSLEVARETVRRLEAKLRARGVTPPTTRHPSDPPPSDGGRGTTSGTRGT